MNCLREVPVSYLGFFNVEPELGIEYYCHKRFSSRDINAAGPKKPKSRANKSPDWLFSDTRDICRFFK
jgi:hypothetical protein